MSYKEFILDYFINGQDSKAKLIEGLPNDCPAYCFRMGGELGVVIPFDSDVIVDETFSGCSLSTLVLSLGSPAGKGSYLKLATRLIDNEHNEVFAVFCSDFIDPVYRKDRIDNPLKWWKSWKEVLGNSELDKNPYDVIAEMMVLDYMGKKGLNPSWEGSDAATVDIRSEKYDCEVKSSTNRYSDLVEISSQFQLLKTDRPLRLCYVVFQKTEAGQSIDDLVPKLVKTGFKHDFLESKIKKRGYKPGNSSRKEKYQMLKMWEFIIDDMFPVIDKAVFKEGRPPKGVKKVAYTIDLSELEHEDLEYR